jgi:hypothetical protein
MGFSFKSIGKIELATSSSLLMNDGHIKGQHRCRHFLAAVKNVIK